MSDPKVVYRADVKNLILQMMKKDFNLELQKNCLKNVSITTRETLNTRNTEITLSYQNIYVNSKMLIHHQLLNGVLLKHN